MFKKLVLPFMIGALLLVGAVALLPQGKALAAPVQQFEVSEVVITGTTTLNPLTTEVFTASGFSAGEQIDLMIDGIRVARGDADGSGVYSPSVTIPRSLVFGDVTVSVRNENGDKLDEYTASVEPSVTTDAESGTVGTPFDVNGYGFQATETYTVTFTDDYDVLQASCVATTATVTEQLGTGTTTALGSFSLDTEVPDVITGTYYVVAIGGDSATCAVAQ